MSEVISTRMSRKRPLIMRGKPRKYMKIKKCGLVAQDRVFLIDNMCTFVDITDIDKREEESLRSLRFLKTGEKRNVKRYLEYARRKVKHTKSE